MRTLIVEDDIVSRTLLQRLLAEFGECDTAINGREAMEILSAAIAEQRPFDLVMLDIMMPFLNGVEVLRELRECENAAGFSKDAQAKVIVTTSLSDGANLQSAFDAGCAAYLVKPINKDDVLRLIRELRLSP